MKKLYKFVLLTLVLVMLSALPAMAAKTYMNDEAELLTEAEREAVEKKLKSLSEKHEMDIVVVTIDSLGYKDEQDFADDYYDYYGYADDGIILLYSYDDDIRYVSTSGFCIDAFEDNLSDITNAISEYMAYGNYADAFIAFANVCDDVIKEEKNSDFIMSIVISVVVGLVVAFVVGNTLKAQLKSVQFKSRAEDYMKNGSLNVTQAHDLFLYRTIHRTARPKSNSGSHRSSSGRSHGGGRV